MFSNMSFKFGSFSTIHSSSTAKKKSFYSSLIEEKGGLLMDSSNTSAEKTSYFVVLDDDTENIQQNDNDDIDKSDNSSGNNNTIIINYHWIAACVTANCLVPVQKYLLASSGRPYFIYELNTVSKSSLDHNNCADKVKPLAMHHDLTGSTNQPPDNNLLDIYLQILVQKQSQSLSRPTNVSHSLEGIAGIRGRVFSLSGFPKRRTSNDNLLPDKGELELGIRLAGGRVGTTSHVLERKHLLRLIQLLFFLHYYPR